MSREIQINTRQLLAAAYGSGIIPSYALTQQELQQASSNVTVVESDYDGSEQGEVTGELGLPVFQIATFKARQQALTLKDILIDVSLNRNIVKTPINGLHGTIKEFISNGDYEITIRGFLIGSNPYKAPEKEIRQFRQFFTEQTRQLAVEAKLLDCLGIYSLVVENWQLQQIPTMPNVRAFELKCISDFDTTQFISVVNK